MNKNSDGTSNGRLPCSAPLGYPYVPFQETDSPQYEPNTAIIKGTLFPDLDLPFMDYINTKELPATPLTEMQTLSFAIQELALYLDTHSDDKQALELYRAYQKLYAEGKEKFEAKYGPLSHYGISGNGYCWLNSPWPWENAEKED